MQSIILSTNCCEEKHHGVLLVAVISVCTAYYGIESTMRIVRNAYYAGIYNIQFNGHEHKTDLNPHQ